MARNISLSIGKLAEKTFAQLCAEAELICNKSYEDEAGWDYFIQFDLDDDYIGTLDKRRPTFGAFVQVKASTRTVQTVRVKLSNGERMITEPRPVLFAVFHYTPRKDLLSLQLAHVNNATTCFVLEKLRNIPVEKIDKIHKVEIDIPLRIMDPQIIKCSSDLINALKKACGNEVDEYIANKALQRKIAGYNDRSFSGTFSLPSKTGHRALVAAMLGERESVSVKDFRLTETRFGIEKEIAFSRSARLSIEITTPQRVIFVAEDVSRGLRASFDCDMLVPTLPGLASDDFRVLVKNKYLSFQINQKNGIHKWHFEAPREENLSWDLMRNIVAMMAMCEAGGFKISCYARGKKIASGAANRDQNKTSKTDYIKSLINCIDRLCENEIFRYFAVLSINDINKTIRFNRNLIYLVTESQNMRLEATINQTPSRAYTRGAMIHPLLLHVNDGLLGILVVTHANVAINGSQIEATKISTKLSDAIFDESEVNILLKLRILAKTLAEEMEDDCICVIDEKIHDDNQSNLHLLSEGTKA